MTDTITINDIDYSDVIDGLDTLPISVKLNTSNKTVEISITGDLTFNGRAYDLIFNTFFSNCNGKAGKLSGSVYFADVCVTKDFVIRYDQVTYDPCSCTAEVQLKIESPESECYRYLNSKAIWQNGFIDAFTHPKIHYCSQPGFLHYIFLFVFFPLMCPVLLALELIETIVNAIISVLNAIIPGSGPIDPLNITSLDDVDEIILGCGKRHVAPVIREVMQYHTDKCGLSFQSSILVNDPLYSNSALLHAQNERGIDIKDGSFNWIDENRWNVSCIDVLNKISLLHNAEYRIKNGTLVYERKDYFLTDFEPAEINLIELCKDGSLANLEYSIIRGAKAYGKFEYQKDAVDTEGNRMISDYNDIVEWNDPVQEHLSGEHSVSNEFSPARFMFDRQTQEKNGAFDYDRRVDKLRRYGGYVGGVGIFLGCPLPVSNKRERDLILENNTALNIKVLALEQNTPRSDAKTIRRKRGSDDGIDFYDYNWPYYYDANYINPELYQRFHFIDNPNLSEGAYFEISGTVKTLLTKQIAQDILTYGVDIKIITHLGDGKATDGFLIDRAKKEVVISGIKIKCVQ